MEFDVTQLVLGVLGLMGLGGGAAEVGRRVVRRKHRRAEDSTSDGPSESLVPRSQAREETRDAINEAIRLERIEGKIDRLADQMNAGFRRVDERQLSHEEEDDRRHAAVLAELTRAGERLHEHDSWHTRHVGHIAEVRERLEMDTQVGPAPTPRQPRSTTRPGIQEPARATKPPRAR